MIDSAALLKKLPEFCMVRAVDKLPRGHVRIQTGFLYPDGSSVDVFIVDDPSQPLLPASRISDLGQTMDFLLHHDVKPWTSQKRKAQLESAISLYGVELEGGALVKPIIDTDSSLREGIILLGQACVRMADLLFTKRLQLQSVFTEEVEEFLSDADLDYQPGVQLPGSFAPIAVDFLVHGKTTTSAVLTLFSRIKEAAHVQANEVFRKVHDLSTAQRPEQRVTLVDDTVDVLRIYREDDLRRIESYSTLVAFSDRSTVQALLAA